MFSRVFGGKAHHHSGAKVGQTWCQLAARRQLGANKRPGFSSPLHVCSAVKTQQRSISKNLLELEDTPTSKNVLENLPVWAPRSPATKKFEDATLVRVYEADTHPAVYDFAAWRKHRSDSRYVVHMITLFQSRFFRELAPALSVLVLISCAVGGYETALQMEMLPYYFPDIAVTAAEPFQQASFALSLMLVFRINECYQRYVEARKAWGDVVHYCRNIVRQGLAHIPDEAEELQDALVRWSIAFPRVFKAHLREDGDAAKEVEGVLMANELELLMQSGHKPSTVLQVMGEVIEQAHLDSTTALAMENNLSQLALGITTCERILKNPIPLSYTRHSARFLVLWLIWLPFSMWEKIHWGIVPAAGIIGFLLLGIDEIAIQLEEPFGILPLETLCNSVLRNLTELQMRQGKVKQLVAQLQADHNVSYKSMSIDDEDEDVRISFANIGNMGALSSMDAAVLTATAELALTGQGNLMANLIQGQAARAGPANGGAGSAAGGSSNNGGAGPANGGSNGEASAWGGNAGNASSNGDSSTSNGGSTAAGGARSNGAGNAGSSNGNGESASPWYKKPASAGSSSGEGPLWGRQEGVSPSGPGLGGGSSLGGRGLLRSKSLQEKESRERAVVGMMELPPEGRSVDE